MNGLLRKDRAWALPMAIGGAIALGLVGGHRGFLRTFVMGTGWNEELFYTAACMGLFVGALARGWDRLIGTHDFLRHRPASAAQLAVAPLRSAAVVVAAWTVAAPALSWGFAALSSGIFAPSHWDGYGELMATVAIAWPAAAVGSAAVALPLRMWLRGVFGVGAALVAGYLIVNLAQGRDHYSDLWIYLSACVAMTALFGWLAVAADQVPFDADAPWSARTTLVFGGAVAILLGLTGAGGALDGQRMAIYELQRAYPEISASKDRVVLWQHGDKWSDRWICDGEHRRTDEPFDSRGFRDVSYDEPWVRRLFDLDAPQWHRFGDMSSMGGVTLVMNHEGCVWGYVRDTGRLFRIGRKGRPEEASAPGSRFEHVDDLGVGPQRQWHVLMIDGADQSLWHLDVDSGELVSFDLPDGDRFRHVRRYRKSDGGDLERAPMVRSLFEQRGVTTVEYVEGERGSYIVSNGQWVELVLPPGFRDRHSRERLASLGMDPVEFDVQLPANDRHPAFEHHFAPRTFEEQAQYAHASAWSLLRPPVLQVPAYLRARSERGVVTVLDDHLLRGQSRTWLLVLCGLMAGLSAWVTRRRLRRLGAEAPVVTFWTVAAAALGVAGLVACWMCARPRAFRRPVLEAAPAPRIGANPVHQEVMS